MSIKTLAELIHREACHLLRALTINTESPIPIMTLHEAACEFYENGDLGPAACIIDTLYTIAGRNQQTILTFFDSSNEETIIPIFLGKFEIALIEATGSGEGEKYNDEDDSFTLRDLHVPVVVPQVISFANMAHGYPKPLAPPEGGSACAKNVQRLR